MSQVLVYFLFSWGVLGCFVYLSRVCFDALALLFACPGSRVVVCPALSLFNRCFSLKMSV